MKKESPRRYSKGQVIRIIILIISIIVFIISAIGLFSQLNDYRKSDKLYEEAKKYTKVAEDNTGHNDDSTNKDKVEDKNIDWKDMIDVDFAALKKENEDIVGWLYFENEDISYPILYSGDNSEYLRKAYDGQQLTAGSIFMEGRNLEDFTDLHTIIYGHNMRNLSMFGRLKYYKTEENYYQTHQYFQIITENKKYRYQIFAFKDVPDNSSLYTIFRPGNDEFNQFVVDNIKAGSYLNSDISVKNEDHVVTLSTCTYDDDKRFIVSAVRVDETE